MERRGAQPRAFSLSGPIKDRKIALANTVEDSVNRETETRPNTLVEIGVAIGLGGPYFYFNRSDERTVQIEGMQETITTASDLAGMFYMPYREHDVLLCEFAVRLPPFMCDKGLAKHDRA